MPLRRVCTALLVPRRASKIDLDATERLLRFQQRAGVHSFALNGATGEYTRSTFAELVELLHRVRSVLSQGDRLVLGVGGPDSVSVQKLLDLGREMNVDGCLLPVPYYFPLEQDDITAFVSGLELHSPTYLYNLPSFTTSIKPRTALELCLSHASIVGVKDSSGSLETLQQLSLHAPGTGRIIGNDQVVVAALQAGICDGVVSGVAGVLPELMLELYSAASEPAEAGRTAVLAKSLEEYIGWLNRFPVPWGLKLTAQFRGLFQAEFNIPLAARRHAQAADFEAWLAAHRDELRIA